MYANYGGRGIRVCNRWRSFENFLADMGDRPNGWSLERKKVNGNYCKSNCEWVPLSGQAKNRRYCRVLLFAGKSMTINEWAREVGIPRQAITKRILSGWTAEQALTIRPTLGNKRLGIGKGATCSLCVTHNGETKTIADWAQLIGISKKTIYGRLLRGWSIADALRARKGGPQRKPR